MKTVRKHPTQTDTRTSPPFRWGHSPLFISCGLSVLRLAGAAAPIYRAAEERKSFCLRSTRVRWVSGARQMHGCAARVGAGTTTTQHLYKMATLKVEKKGVISCMKA